MGFAVVVVHGASVLASASPPIPRSSWVMPSAAGAAEEPEPLTAAEASDATCPGLCRPPNKRFTPPKTAKLFLALAWLEGALAIAFAIYTLAHSDNPSLHQYSTLAIFLMVAFAYFATNAVYAENVFQLFAAGSRPPTAAPGGIERRSLRLTRRRARWPACGRRTVFVSILYTGFVVFKYAERATWGHFWVHWAGTVLGVKLGFEAAYLALCFPVYKRFGYRIFKVVGADEHMQCAAATHPPSRPFPRGGRRGARSHGRCRPRSHVPHLPHLPESHQGRLRGRHPARDHELVLLRG